MNEVFVFQNKNKIVRLPVSKFLLIPNVDERLFEIINKKEREHSIKHKGADQMKPFVKIIRKVDIERQYRHMWSLEQDYELASLSQALKDNDAAEIVRSKNRLKAIHEELEEMAYYS